jgi:hypothetical protein
MADIFISYWKSDHALALKLSAFLEAEGWTVWWDKSLGAADLYRDKIMQQLVAARAVITIWTENSVKSDWVRAEAGQAKSEGKLIPVKTPELTYADIPLPFGEMHTENIGSTGLIRAAIVAQLAKPAVSQSPFWQITSTFKYQVLTWVGIVGSAITLFANLSGVLDLADWASEIATHWHEWTQMFWASIFKLINIQVPNAVMPTLSFSVSALILVAGLNLSMRRGKVDYTSQNMPSVRGRIILFMLGCLLFYVMKPVVLLIAVLGAIGVMSWSNVDFNFDVDGGALVMITDRWVTELWGLLFPLGYLLWSVKDRGWVLVNSLLFLVMTLVMLIVPWHRVGFYTWEINYSHNWAVNYVIGQAVASLLQFCWMAVILFGPLQQLARRLAFVVLGVLTLVVLSEISKLDLHQYLRPPKVSDVTFHTGRSSWFATRYMFSLPERDRLVNQTESYTNPLSG